MIDMAIDNVAQVVGVGGEIIHFYEWRRPIQQTPSPWEVAIAFSDPCRQAGRNVAFF